MLTTLNKMLVFGLFVSFFTSGCVVGRKKFDDVNAKKSALEVEKAEAETALQSCEGENERLQKQLDKAHESIAGLQSDTGQLGALYRELIGDYKALSKHSASDAAKISDQLVKVNKLMKELEQKDQLLAQDRERIETLEKDLVTREEKLAEMERVLNDKDQAVKALKDKISEALLSFEDGDLTVEMKGGKVYVSMAEQLLFKSGSYAVDQKGKDALQKIAEVLKKSKDLNVTVEGHTDDVPYRGSGTIKDNWDLSVLRATSIVRILADAGVESQRISATGRGEFVPKVSGTTPEDRKKNRRTEIIISPQLEVLYELLDQ